MTKQELLNRCIELNLRLGDKVKVKFTEQGKEDFRLYRMNKNIKSIDIEESELKLTGYNFGYMHYNRYGEQKATPSTGKSIRVCSVYFSFNRLSDACKPEWIESIEVITNTSRRRKNHWLDIESY